MYGFFVYWDNLAGFRAVIMLVLFFILLSGATTLCELFRTARPSPFLDELSKELPAAWAAHAALLLMVLVLSYLMAPPPSM